MYDNRHGKTTKDIEKEINYLKGELANTNQLFSKFRNKNSTYFFTRRYVSTETNRKESDENIDFAIDKPSQCIFRLSSTNCHEGDDLLKIKFDQQLKETHKCHHQKYLNTKPIISRIHFIHFIHRKLCTFH